MQTKELADAIEDIKAAPKVNIKGKQYTQVASRLEVFRKHFGHEFGIDTESVESYDPNIVRVKASIIDSNNRTIATGLAEEDRRDGKINSTSAMENCETSAIGRALAAFGLIGGEYASSYEMEMAVAPQRPFNPQPNTGHVNVLEQNWQRRIDGPDERQMVNSRPEIIPHIPDVPPIRTHVPEFQQWTDLLGEVSRIADVIVHVNTIDDLTRYWAELTEFLKVVQEKDGPLFSELRAAFSVRNKQLRQAERR